MFQISSVGKGLVEQICKSIFKYPMLSKDFMIITNHAFPPIGAGGLKCEGAHSECFGAVTLYF